MNSAKKANAGTISIDEMAGGTLTISNGGVYGSLFSTPIINPPQMLNGNRKKNLHQCRI
ncbi:2-oxoglutarate dehydrogenase E2 subunit [Medicago truncatula]|uniref:dihydrolipoyllysine-residue succinyltransferase n=1 Tax=Medicago truncatula TaxID=3880 RepID=G7K8H9_MEDTR|nr:2-oxoglutarate dehydrogenase E2 subunit [Medicago truncatula]